MSERSKCRKTGEVRSAVENEVTLHAARSSLRAKGLWNASQLLKEIEKVAFTCWDKKAYRRSCLKNVHKLTPQDMTRQQYEVVRETKKTCYPCYDLLLKGKEECRVHA